jgi:hypothetical protein
VAFISPPSQPARLRDRAASKTHGILALRFRGRADGVGVAIRAEPAIRRLRASTRPQASPRAQRFGARQRTSVARSLPVITGVSRRANCASAAHGIMRLRPTRRDGSSFRAIRFSMVRTLHPIASLASFFEHKSFSTVFVLLREDLHRRWLTLHSASKTFFGWLMLCLAELVLLAGAQIN